MLASSARCIPAAVFCLALLSTRAAAQEREPRAYDPDRPALDEPIYPDDPLNAFEFALGDDGLWFAYRNGLHRGDGYASLGLFAGEDDDYALAGRLMRFGEPRFDVPLGFGVGLGVLGAALDETDSEILAITLTGAVDFALDEYFSEYFGEYFGDFVLGYPLRIGLEISYAPDVATFLDGQRVLEVLGRLEVDLSSWATVFAGYRHLELDVEDEDDAELDSALQAGVRLGF